jgi:hypothetical protein
MRARTVLHPRLAIVAAIGIIGVAVFGGALSASSAPSSVTITTAGGTTNAPGGTISGGITWTTDGGTVGVRVEDEDGNVQNFCSTDGPYLVTDTTWSCAVDLQYGYNYITAYSEATDDPGTIVTSNEILFYRTSTTPYVQFSAMPDFEWAPGPNFTISGNSSLSTDVTISIDGVVEPTCADLVPDGAGDFSCTITKAPGTWDLEAVQSGSAPDLEQVVITIPPLVINNPDPINADAGDIASLYGTLDWQNGIVQASITGQPPTCSTTDYTDGVWGCNLDLTGVPDGSYTAVLTQTYGDAPATTATVGITVTSLITPTMSCAFAPGGQAVVTSGADVNGSVWDIVPGQFGSIGEPGLCSGNAGTPVTEVGEWGPDPIADCTPTCTLDLAPGTYNVNYSYSDEVGAGYDFSQFDYFFTIPSAPAVATVSTSGVASGTGTAGDRIRLVNGAGAQLCTTVVTGSGTWSCTVTLPKTAGQARAYQVDAASGGMSAYSASVTLPALPVVPAAVPAPTPRPWSISFGEVTEFRPGDSLTIEGTDAPANATIDVELHSTPILLGSTTADALGAFSLTTTIPMDAEPGAHNIVVIATPTDGSAPIELQQPVTVIVDPVAEDAEEEPADASGLAPSAGAAREQPGAPSALSAGLVSPAEILSNPLAVVTAGSLGLALVLLVLVPAEFFGEALANHYGSMAGFFARRRGLKRVVEGAGAWIEANRFWAGAGLVFVTSVVFCFIDPSFGFDLTSLRLLLSCAASILLVNFLSSGITERIAEKAWKVPTRLEVMPWGLAIAIVGVLVSRLLDFSPGFLIGSIIGVSVIGEVTKKLEIRVILLWSTVVWAVAMLAWVLAPLVPELPAESPAAFVTGLLGDSLTATAAAGLTALLVALLPIALFDGGVLFKHSKLRWAIAFGIAVASFSIVVLPSAGNWLGLGDGLLTWLLLTLGFIAVAIVTYLIAVRKNVLGRSRLLKRAEPTA